MTNIRRMLMLPGFILILLIIAASLFSPKAHAADKSKMHAQAKTKKHQVIERIIKIEGSLERPRIIYIVSRARLWQEFIPKNYVKDILRPVHPEHLVQTLKNK